MKHWKRTTKRALQSLLFFAVLAPFAACQDQECLPGLECDCIGGEWDVICGGSNKAGCQMTCTQGADCALTCPGGNCNLECNGAVSCALECPKGGCNLTCTNTESCKITQCSGNCHLSCGDAKTCTSACGVDQSCTTQ